MKYLYKRKGEQLDGELLVRPSGERFLCFSLPKSTPLKPGKSRLFRVAPSPQPQIPQLQIVDVDVMGDGTVVVPFPEGLQPQQFLGPIDHPLFMAFISHRDWRDLSRGPRAIMQQAIANLSAARRVPLRPGQQALVMHYKGAATMDSGAVETAVSAKRRAATSNSHTLLSWKDCEDYLKQRWYAAERGLVLTEGKLYSHYRGATISPLDLTVLVSKLARETGKFDYEPYSFEDATRLAERCSVVVEEVSDLAPASTAVRIFEGRSHVRDYILVQRSLPSSAKTFLVLYELCHFLRDFAEIRELAVDAPPDSVLSLPPGLVRGDSVAAAIDFAMTGLLPTAHLVWLLRHHIRDQAPVSALYSSDEVDGLLTYEVETSLLAGICSDTSSTHASPVDWSRAVAARVRGALGEVDGWIRGVSGIVNHDVFTPGLLSHAKGFLNGPWAHVGKNGCFEEVNGAYLRLLDCEESQDPAGRPIQEFGDSDSLRRFDLVKSERRANLAPFFYYWRFPRGAGPPIVVRLFSWPVIDEKGVLTGSFAVFDDLATEERGPKKIAAGSDWEDLPPTNRTPFQNSYAAFRADRPSLPERLLPDSMVVAYSDGVLVSEGSSLEACLKGVPPACEGELFIGELDREIPTFRFRRPYRIVE